ncbi:MAG: glycosyltransferase [Polyangia bacterium]
MLWAWVALALWFTIGCLLETRRLLRAARARVEPSVWPSLAILRPCAGLEPALEANLWSTVTARYDGARELFLLVACTSDPAHAVALLVKERARELPVRVEVVVTSIATLHNRKVAQLAVAQPLSAAPIVVVIDSDLQIDDTSLPALVTALVSDPKAGAASCPPVDIDARTLGDHASAALLSSTPHSFYCLAALAERSSGAHVLCGAFIAVHRHVLEQLGGFSSLEPFLGEDFELARRLHAHGYTIPTAAAPAHVTDHGRSLSTVIARFHRWATVIRQQRPHLMVTYPLLLACTPLLLVVACLIHTKATALGVAAVLTLRVLLAARLRRAYGLRADPLRSLAAVLLGEALILLSSTRALMSPVVSWRGHRYRVARNGILDLIR